MLRRLLGLARAGMAAGVFLGLLALVAPVRGDEPADPLPGPDAGATTVSLLRAVKDGSLQAEARGQGDNQVHLVLHNTSTKRLEVVLPPGLVASATVGQGAGGAGGGGGFQSMGLGAPARNSGSFGEFQGDSGGEGFRSTPVTREVPGIDLGGNQTVDVTVPAVCLNFGIPTPTPNDVFELEDVDDYTQDARARKALRSLATLGTSQKVAQAVAWNVFNGMSFSAMSSRAGKIFNPQELALAARFVQVLDSSSATELVEPGPLRNGRVFIDVRGEGDLQAKAKVLATELDNAAILGLPARSVTEAPGEDVGPAALWITLELTAKSDGQPQARANVKAHGNAKGWVSLGLINVPVESADKLTGAAVAGSLDHAIAAKFITARAEKKATGTTVFRVQNRLPFTVANLTVRAGRADDAGRVAIAGLGLGPARATFTPVPAATIAVERAEVNGL